MVVVNVEVGARGSDFASPEIYGTAQTRSPGMLTKSLRCLDFPALRDYNAYLPVPRGYLPSKLISAASLRQLSNLITPFPACNYQADCPPSTKPSKLGYQVSSMHRTAYLHTSVDGMLAMTG